MIESREELLISHVVDGDATPAEWRELETIAADDSQVWKRLAEAQRDSALLTAALSRAASVADGVDVPGVRYATQSTDSVSHVRLNRLGAWTGWAVAAVVAIIASVRLAQVQQTPSTPGNQAQLVNMPIETAAQAFQAYLDKGRESGEVVGEIPGRLLVETKPVQSGSGYEVIYLRQVMERTIVPDLYQLAAQDDAGRPTLVRYQPHVRNSM